MRSHAGALRIERINQDGDVMIVQLRGAPGAGFERSVSGRMVAAACAGDDALSLPATESGGSTR